MTNVQFLELIGLLATLLYLAGAAAAVHAVMTARTAQGATAWALCLLFMPYLALPAYAVFGRGKFAGYVRARRAGDSQIDHLARALEKKMRVFRNRDDEIDPNYFALEQLARMPFTSHNDARLLINGREAFDAMFKGIDAARDYIIVQFYIIQDDNVGREFKERLIRKAREGVRVYVLYDEIGSYNLPKAYRREIVESGGLILPFRTSKGLRNRFQINFRNHRKIVVIDGETAYVGGMNIADAYLGDHPRLGKWRDTHVEVSGPVVQAIQFAFLEDWFWATGDLPELDWTPRPSADGNRNALVLASDPSDDLETCGLFFVHAMNTARKRIWIASPYFVPDLSLVYALQLAALRGVDVRVMLPERADHILVYLSGFAYIAETEQSGIKFYRYQPGFLHQKVLLVDDDFAAVGTANFDNRSIRLNFELMLLVANREFAAQVSQMLENDLAQCRQVGADELLTRGFWFRFAVRLARLTAPIQ
jgi:cardiolipin synthase A/B